MNCARGVRARTACTCPTKVPLSHRSDPDAAGRAHASLGLRALGAEEAVPGRRPEARHARCELSLSWTTVPSTRSRSHADKAFLTARIDPPDSRKRDNWRVVPSAA